MNRIIIVNISMLIAIFVLFAGKNLHAWDPDTTHGLITMSAVKLSLLDETQGNYLKSVGLLYGLESPLKWDMNSDGVMSASEQMSALEWIYYVGARREDGNNREVNHFFNPLKPWENAGLWGIWRPTVVWSISGTLMHLVQND